MLVPAKLNAPLPKPTRFAGAMEDTSDQEIAPKPLPKNATVMQRMIAVGDVA